MPPAIFLGIFILSGATLLLEVSLTRILSITQGYHFAFLIVSTALLGTGSAGAYVALLLKWRPFAATRWIVIGPLLFGLAACGGYLALNAIPFDTVRMAWEVRQIGWFMLAYLILAVPFFFSGLTIASAFLIGEMSAGKVYFADLCGAAVGALLPLALFAVTGGPGIVAAAASLGILGGVFIWAGMGRPRIAPSGALSGVLALCAIGAFFIFPGLYELNLSPYRGLKVALQYPDARLLRTEWNAVSRVDLVESPLVRFAPGLSLTHEGALPRQVGLAVDADRLQAVTSFDGAPERLEFLNQLPSAVPYVLGKPKSVFVAGPGGGLDLLMALYFGADGVTGAEPNPLIPAVLSEIPKAYGMDIYGDPRVRLMIGHERSILQAGSEPYDLIVIPGVRDIASGGGPASVAEEYSHTIEAFQDYWGRLAEEGWLSVTRYLEPQPVYTARLLATAIEAVGLSGIEPAERLVVLRSWGTITFMIKRGGISGDEIRALKEFSQSRRFDLVHYPGMGADEANRYNLFQEPVYFRLVQALLDEDAREALYRAYPFQIRPTTDDRPFFSYVLRWDRLAETYALVREKWMFLIEGGMLLPILLLQAAAVAALLILLPTWLRVRTGPSETPWNRGRVFIYFFCIALGFMWVEMAMIQRLILYLVHPVHAISIVLAALLLFAGIGSRTVAKTTRLGIEWKTPFIGVLCLLILAEGWLLPRLLEDTLSLAMGWRFVLAVAALAPLGLLMGMPFPLGIQRLKRSGREAPIAWALAINGSTSVVAVILSVLLTLSLGITGVLFLAAGAYGVAGWAAMGIWTAEDRRGAS